MKQLRLFSILILLVCSAGCDMDSDTDCEPMSSHPLDGEWHLISVYCECLPVNLELGENVWMMDVEAGVLTVEDNTTEDYPAMPETGTYDLIVTEDSLYYELPYGYLYFLENGDLFLDQMSEVDGPLVRLTRP